MCTLLMDELSTRSTSQPDNTLCSLCSIGLD
jgi:hypothetical protein